MNGSWLDEGQVDACATSTGPGCFYNHRLKLWLKISDYIPIPANATATLTKLEYEKAMANRLPSIVLNSESRQVSWKHGSDGVIGTACRWPSSACLSDFASLTPIQALFTRNESADQPSRVGALLEY